jgi:hypothetical protein
MPETASVFQKLSGRAHFLFRTIFLRAPPTAQLVRCRS